MNFLFPVWLFSIAAISIPVIIHLWNIRPGKTLKVGSIALIDTSSRKRSRSFNLMQLLLLLLRCLLLILVAIVLAMPYLKKQTASGKSKGWLLISKKDFQEAYQNYKPKIDSLIKAGYEFHYFNTGFQKTTIAQALTDTLNHKTGAGALYWSLLQQLNLQLPATVPVYIITPNAISNFNGSKPGTALQLHWLTYTTKDSTSTWVQKAWFTDNKEVHIITGSSKPSGTVYHAESIKQNAIENSAYVIDISNGKPFIRIKNSRQKPIEIDTAALKIDIAASPNTPDAGYVKAALQSIGEFTQQNIRVSDYSGNSATKKGWLFWLTDKPLSKATMLSYNNILVYENGKVESINSTINTGDASSSERVIPLYKSVASKTYPGEIEWSNGYGNPVLTTELSGNTHIHHFYSRFNPGWNDLVWDAGFPRKLCCN